MIGYRFWLHPIQTQTSLPSIPSIVLLNHSINFPSFFNYGWWKAKGMKWSSLEWRTERNWPAAEEGAALITHNKWKRRATQLQFNQLSLCWLNGIGWLLIKETIKERRKGKWATAAATIKLFHGMSLIGGLPWLAAGLLAPWGAVPFLHSIAARAPFKLIFN